MVSKKRGPLLQELSDRQGLFGAAYRYKWVVVTFILVMSALAIAYSASRPPSVVAVASVVLAEPSASAFGVNDVRSTERIVANQLEIFQSAAVAGRAAELLDLQNVDVSVAEVLRNVTISNIRNTDVITVSATGPDEETAAALASAMLTAYQDVQLEQDRVGVDTIVDRLNAAEEVLTSDLNEVNASIAQLRAARDLSSQIDITLNRLADIGRALNDPNVGSEDAEALRAQENQLVDQLSALRTAFVTESERPELQALIRSQEVILDQLASIAGRRSDVEIETETGGTGVLFVSPPAITDAGTGSSRAFIAAAGAFLGLLMGLGVAYALDNARGRIDNRLAPAIKFGLTYLGDVPDFEAENLDSALPVRDYPRSASAEAFRFVAGSTELRAERTGVKVLAVTSATVGAGKSTVVANLAFSVARSGRSVLVIDADFGNQAVSTILLGSRPNIGIVEILQGWAEIDRATAQLVVQHGSVVNVLSRGTHPSSAVDVFRSKGFEALLGKLAETYDVVIVDCPPAAQVAYASDLVRMADGAIVVIPFGASVRGIEELSRRLDLIETPVIGYVFNKAPMRAEMLQSGGSMKDVLGDLGLLEPVPPRRR